MSCRSRGAAACVLLTLSLAVAGCGDSRLDTGELHDQATSACNKAHTALVALRDPQSPAAVEPFLRGAASATGRLWRQLQAMKPPSSAQASFTLASEFVRNEANVYRTGVKQLATGGDAVVVLRSVADQIAASAPREQAAWDGLSIDACANR